LWDKDFPGLIPDSPVVYQPIRAEGFEVEGNRLRAIETGHTDTPTTAPCCTCRPSAWSSPATSPTTACTSSYLLDAQRLLTDKPTPREFYDQMLERYPHRLNLGPLWYSALGLLG
jgi:hypothetical protein